MDLIEVDSLSKAYPGFLLDSITLTVPEGMIMGLVGENGAGKTTLMRTLLGFHKADSGSFSVLGCSDPLSNKHIMNDIGVVSEDIGLPDRLTSFAIGRILSCLYANWDGAYYDSLRQQLDLPADKAFRELSRGNQMKAAIICALAHHPKLLILDEATSGLDPLIRDEILDIFLEFVSDGHHSILMSSHIVSDLEKACDQITFIHKGKLLLSERKSVLKDDYRMVRCSKDVLSGIDPEQIIGTRETPYGTEAIVKKAAGPSGAEAYPADLGDLFVMMVKGERK